MNEYSYFLTYLELISMLQVQWAGLKAKRATYSPRAVFCPRQVVSV